MLVVTIAAAPVSAQHAEDLPRPPLPTRTSTRGARERGVAQTLVLEYDRRPLGMAARAGRNATRLARALFSA